MQRAVESYRKAWRGKDEKSRRRESRSGSVKSEGARDEDAGEHEGCQVNGFHSESLHSGPLYLGWKCATALTSYNLMPLREDTSCVFILMHVVQKGIFIGHGRDHLLCT